MVQKLATVPEAQRALVTCEGAFSYLARDAGLREVYIWAVNAEQQATPQQIARAIEFVKANTVPAVFCESTVSDAPMRQVEGATGAKFGGVLYVDSLSEADGPVPTYLDLIRHDSKIITEALVGASARSGIMSNPAILVENVTVHYGEVLALDAASLTLDTARICGLIGMNGSGKSTLFKVIMGMITPDAGRVLINGESPAKARKEGGIGYVPQSEDVDWQFPLSVRDVVMMGRDGHQGFTRRPSKAMVPPSSLPLTGWNSPSSRTGRSASSPAARRSALSWPGASPRAPP